MKNNNNKRSEQSLRLEELMGDTLTLPVKETSTKDSSAVESLIAESLSAMENASENVENLEQNPKNSSIPIIDQESNSIQAENSEISNSVGNEVEIVESWQGGYKVELDFDIPDLAQDSGAWQIELNGLNGDIQESYGLEIISTEGDKLTVMPEMGYRDGSYDGETGSGILIMDGDLTDTGSNLYLGSKNEDPLAEADKDNSGSSPNLDLSPQSPVSSPQTGKFNYGEALQKNFLFYEANQSGELSPNNRLEWRSDSTLNDGSNQGVDLEGGYFDAGDHVKFGQPMAYSIGTLALGGIEYKEAYQKSGQFDKLLETVKHGTDYFLKAHETDSSGNTTRFWVQVGEGGSANDHGYWGSPETVEANTNRNAFYIDAAHPGSDVAASTAASLALSSELFRGVDDQYADKLLDNAKSLFAFAEQHQGKYSDSVPQASPFYTSWSGYGDELAYGAAAIAKVTGDAADLEKAENYFKEKVGGLGDWASAADDQSYTAAVILSQISEDPYFKQQTEGWLNRWVNGEGAVNYTEGGFAHRANWGSVPVTASAAFLGELYSDTVQQNQSYSDFASNQVDYILGDNPKNFSYMVGFGDNYAQSPHHRGSAGSQPLDSSSTPNDHILYGAIVGGPSEANDYSYNDRRDDWITNEVGTSYNAPVAGALIQQYDNFGGDPLSNEQLDALPGVAIEI
jgi:hypothetical protein